MAQTKKKRKRKHKGTQGGGIDRRGRTSRPANRQEARARARRQMGDRRDVPPTWRSSFNRALIAAGIFLALLILLFGQPVASSVAALGVHADPLRPDGLLHRQVLLRPAPGLQAQGQGRREGRVDGRPHAHRRAGGGELLRLRARRLRPRPRRRSRRGGRADPGDRSRRWASASTRSCSPTPTSTTSARSRRSPAPPGAPVYCPELEVPVLADIMAFVPWPGFGPYESYDADETVKGGETLELAGMEIDVLFTPGHSPGHVTYSIADEQALFSGDVLFQGSVGRTDLPGGDPPDPDGEPAHAGRVLPGGDDRVSRPHGDHDARRRAGDQPVPRPRWPVDSLGDERALQGPARHLRRAARGLRRAGGRLRGGGGGASSAPATGGSRRRSFEDTELFARGVGGSTDIVRKEMFTFSDQGEREPDAAPGGHGARSAAPTSSTGCRSCRSR